jgi:undecaprenyl-diphosphatase
MAHAADNSMPSSHVTLGLIIVGLLIGMRCRLSAAIAAAMVTGLAWARIYLGIHWPIDMLGALVSAAISLAVTGTVEWLLACIRQHLTKTGKSNDAHQPS